MPRKVQRHFPRVQRTSRPNHAQLSQPTDHANRNRPSTVDGHAPPGGTVTWIRPNVVCCCTALVRCKPHVPGARSAGRNSDLHQACSGHVQSHSHFGPRDKAWHSKPILPPCPHLSNSLARTHTHVVCAPLPAKHTPQQSMPMRKQTQGEQRQRTGRHGCGERGRRRAAISWAGEEQRL
jgi:hypothetical protein